MKILFALLLITVGLVGYSQPKLITQATISTVTNVIAPEDNNAFSKTLTTLDGRQFTFNQFGSGVTHTTTWLNNQMIKYCSKDEMSEKTIYRDNEKKITTTISERMGKKGGYYATDSEQLAFTKQLDSMMQSQGLKKNNVENSKKNNVFTITYLNESKIIIGYTCKKALVIETFADKNPDTTTVWFCPDFTLQNLPSTGGISEGRWYSSVTNGMENLAGFPLEYEKNMSHGRKMTVKVEKLDINAVSEKEFELPKNIKIKSLKEINEARKNNERVIVL